MKNKIIRFLVPGASGVRHPLYDYKTKRFFASLNIKIKKTGCTLDNKEREKELTTVETLEEKPLSIKIHGLNFSKLNNNFWIDYSSEIDSKEAYDSIQNILLEIQSIDSKGFLNTIDLKHFPVISKFINYFTENEVYIKGNKVIDSYKWIFNVLMVCLYEYSLKIISNMEERGLLETDLMADFDTLTKNIFSKIDPSIRIKIQKRGISVIQNIYTGFDTEYKNRDLKYNDLISVQLAINSKSLLKVPKYSKYELSSVNTLTGEEYKIDKTKEKDFNYFMVESILNKCINEIRYLKYKNNDTSISVLIEGLKRLNYPYIEKEDGFVFSFPRTPIQPFIYYNEGRGYKFEDMLNQSNLIGEPYLKIDYEKIIDLLNKISKEINHEDDWRENGEREILSIIETKDLPDESKVKELKISKRSRTVLRGLTEGDKVSVTKIRNNYFIAHYTPADLSMMDDFEKIKEELSIVNDSFVTLGKPLNLFDCNTNIIIRDSWLLAPQGHKALESVGSLYDYEKVDLAKDLAKDKKDKLTKNLSKEERENLNMNQYLKENMDLLLEEDKELFERYAIRDAIISLIHGCYMEDFNFNLQGLGIPLTLSSLGSTYVKYKWNLMGYKGYQLSQKYLLGDTSAIQTPKGLFTTSQTGLKLSYYIANYKGGRNESYMYGSSSDLRTIDYDLTSAYTTGMTLLGNPDYNKGRNLSVKELEKMSFNDVLYSYIIMKAKFKFKPETKYPSLPCNIDEDVSVYPLEGESIINGAEYLLAKSQKCKLNITDIYYIPFEKDEKGKLINQPFKDIMHEIQAKRREYPKGTINNLLYKEMGNSIYGSTARGISNKKKFDIKTGSTIRMEAGDLANPIIVSWITAYIRSVVGECLDKISKINGKVVSATTDGFITNIEDLESKIVDLKTSSNSLLKEYKRIRFELSGNDSALEVKKGEEGGKGIISITTRVQLGKEAGIKASTGFQSKTYTLDELDTVFKETLKGKDKSLEFIQKSLRSALDIYKEGGHVTPVYKDRIFRLHYDNKRLIILPKELENTIDFSDVLLESKPVSNKEYSKILRFLSKFHKQRHYNKQTSTLMGNRYKRYIDLAVRNFIKGLLSNPQKYNLNTEVPSYSEIIDFVRDFDDKIKISKSSISHLKGRKMIFKTVPRTKETLEFVKYVKTKYPNFNDKDFLV